MNRKSQSQEFRRRARRELIFGEHFFIGAPVFVPAGSPGVHSCTFEFLGKRPRVGLWFTRRATWVGAYADDPHLISITEREQKDILDKGSFFTS